MEQKTCLLNIQEGQTEGYLYLEQGEITAAISGKTKGEEALFLLLACDNVKITFKKLPKKKITKMIDKPLMSLLMEGMHRIDEARLQNEVQEDQGGMKPRKQSKADNPSDLPLNEPEPQAPNHTTKDNEEKPRLPISQQNRGDNNMGKLEDCLGKLTDVEGFMAAGVFTPNGEMAAQVNMAGVKIAEIGSIANDVLLKAQKATDIMNVGRGNVVHIEAPKAHVIARCLNENTDFSETEAGKAHIHMVLMLDKDANLAMGKMKLESIISEVAAVFR
jgi:hypothetical protein